MDNIIYFVQIGKNKSAYKTKWTFYNERNRAVMYYNGLNVGYGYKKRLLIQDKNGMHVEARQFS